METKQAFEAYLQYRRSAGDASEGYLRTLACLYARIAHRFPVLTEITDGAWHGHQLKLHADGLKWSTVTRYTVALTGLFRHNGIDTQLWFPQGKAIEREAPEFRALDVAERDALLAAFSDLETRRWYVVAFWSAMRKAEIDSLTQRWIDFRRSMINIPARFQKSGRNEAIDLPPRAAKALREQIAFRRMRANGDVPLFGKRDRRRAFWDAVDKAGIDRAGLTPSHVARRTRITQLVDHSILGAQRQARHISLATTQRYALGRLEQARDAGRKADE